MITLPYRALDKSNSSPIPVPKAVIMDRITSLLKIDQSAFSTWDLTPQGPNRLGPPAGSPPPGTVRKPRIRQEQSASFLGETDLRALFRRTTLWPCGPLRPWLQLGFIDDPTGVGGMFSNGTKALDYDGLNNRTCCCPAYPWFDLQTADRES